MSDVSIPGLDVWPTEPLGDLCDITIGRTPSRNRPELWHGNLPWLSIADMNQGKRIWTTKEKITSLGVTESGSRLIPSNTVLLSFKLSIGKVAVTEIDTYTNEAIAALPILDPNKLFSGFLFWTLRSIRLDEEVDTAAKGKTLNKAKLERLAIPLPPLAEQKRIAAVLEKADTLCLQRQNSRQLAEIFLQSVFIDMFGDPVKNAKKWPVVVFGREMSDISYGTSVKCQDSNPDGGITVLRIPNVDSGRINWLKLKFADLSHNERLNLKLKCGDILFVRTNGNPALVARTAVFSGSREAAFASYLIRVRLKKDTVLLPEFVNFVLAMPGWRSCLLKLARTTAGNYNINIHAIKGLELIAPPVELQDKFCRIVSGQRTFISTLAESVEHKEKLFLSIQQRAFRGELDLSKLDLTPDVVTLPETTVPDTPPKDPAAPIVATQPKPIASDTAPERPFAPFVVAQSQPPAVDTHVPKDYHMPVVVVQPEPPTTDTHATEGPVVVPVVLAQPETTASDIVTTPSRYKRPGSFIAPPEIETQMFALEDKLNFGSGDSIPWSEDYFKYRTLSQILMSPFSFSQIWEAVEYDMPDAKYDDVKDTVFEYVKNGILEQRFDEDRREIVFYPHP